MFEVGLSFSLQLVNSIASSIYAQKFFRGKYQKKIVLFVWVGLYFIIQNLILEKLDSTYPVSYFIKVILDIIFILLLQTILYHKNLLKQIFVAVSYVAGKEIIKYIIVVLNYGQHWIIGKFSVILLKRITTMEEVEMWNCILNMTQGLIYVLLYALLLIAYFSIISRKFIKKDYQFHIHEYIFLILPSIATLGISITLKILVFTVENGMTIIMFDKIPATMFWIPLICFLLLGVNISAIILFQKLVQLGEEKQKRAILENQMMQMQREIKEIQDIYADMRGLRHDMKNHLESIAAVIRKISDAEKEELGEYLKKMETTVNRLDFVYKTGNPITDVIIHQKKFEAEKKNISFEADFIYPDKRQIDVYDIGIVLNNALENAVEASSKLEGEKSIFLRSYMKGNLFFIEVENDFSGEIIFDGKTNLPVTSKEDAHLHGIGMGNIQKCAQKYMGDIDITIHDMGSRKKFILTVMMYEK
ncbi:MAG: GHKL domain-containing protein [Lachnospiraceae bacterium]|nr:GHKL domain-containing protein [Lachnospiraceae bacterium]